MSPVTCQLHAVALYQLHLILLTASLGGNGGRASKMSGWSLSTPPMPFMLVIINVKGKMVCFFCFLEWGEVPNIYSCLTGEIVLGAVGCDH